jgi:hypothetical protein
LKYITQTIPFTLIEKREIFIFERETGYKTMAGILLNLSLTTGALLKSGLQSF